MKIPFVGGSSDALSPADDIQECRNFKVEIDSQEAETKKVLVPTEGLKPHRRFVPTDWLMSQGGVEYFSPSDYDNVRVY